MNLLNFIQQYPDEQACIARFKAQRGQNGVVCPKCGFREHFWLKNKSKVLPWVHICIGNVKRLFDQLVMVTTSYSTDFKSKIYNRTPCE